MFRKSYLTILIFSILFPAFSISAQTDQIVQRYRKDQRGAFTERKEGVLERNRIATLFMNNGQIGTWPNSPSLEWPRGSKIDNSDGICFLASAEIKTPDAPNKLNHPLQTSYREWMDSDPVTGELWGFEPVPGYSNPLSKTPAIASNKESWPLKWPEALGLTDGENSGNWYGFFGMKTVPNLEETFFVLDDSKDGEWKRPPFNYLPVASDTNFGGIGLRVEARALQSSNQLVEDVMFWIYDVINIADSTYPKTYFGFYNDIGSGGFNSADDNAGFNKDYNLVYSWDAAGALPDGRPIGYQGFTILEPASPGINAVSVYILGDGGTGGGWPKDDESMWLKMSTQKIDTSIQKKNISMVFASGPYELTPGVKKRNTLAIIMANDLTELLTKKKNVQNVFNGGLQYLLTNEIPSPSGSKITFPSKGSVLSGTVEVKWALPVQFPNSTAYFEIAKEDTNYRRIGQDLTQSGKITFNTTQINDGFFYRLRAYIYDSNGNFLDLIYSDYFTINNEAHVPPEIKITSPKAEETLSGKINIRWMAGDADSDTFKVSIYYRPSSSSAWATLAEGISQKDTVFQWNTENYANSENGFLMAKAVELYGASTDSSIIYPVKLNNLRGVFNGDEFTIERKTRGTGSFSIQKVNLPEITGHDYTISFDSLYNPRRLVFGVKDLSTGKQVLANCTELDGKTESAYFDGLRLIVRSDTVEVIDSLSGLRSAKSNLSMPINISAISQYRIKLPYDYELEFRDSKDIPSLSSTKPYSGPRVNFITRNITKGDTAVVLVFDKNSNAEFDLGDEFSIVEFIDKNKNGINEFSERRFNWQIPYAVKPNTAAVEPSSGDKFLITVKKPFITGDQITFSTKKISGVEGNSTMPSGYFLSQNYPNPFNPATSITYEVAERSKVRIDIINLLGQVVATLVNSEHNPGTYSVRWNGRDNSGFTTASGIYIYRMQAGTFSKSRKLMLLK